MYITLLTFVYTPIYLCQLSCHLFCLLCHFLFYSPPRIHLFLTSHSLSFLSLSLPLYLSPCLSISSTLPSLLSSIFRKILSLKEKSTRWGSKCVHLYGHIPILRTTSCTIIHHSHTQTGNDSLLARFCFPHHQHIVINCVHWLQSVCHAAICLYSHEKTVVVILLQLVFTVLCVCLHSVLIQ